MSTVLTSGFLIIATIKSVLVKEEEVMPAALYVIVAGFAGSIVASRRMFYTTNQSCMSVSWKRTALYIRITWRPSNLLLHHFLLFDQIIQATSCSAS